MVQFSSEQLVRIEHFLVQRVVQVALRQLRLVWITCVMGPLKIFWPRAPRSLNPALSVP